MEHFLPNVAGTGKEKHDGWYEQPVITAIGIWYGFVPGMMCMMVASPKKNHDVISGMHKSTNNITTMEMIWKLNHITKPY